MMKPQFSKTIIIATIIVLGGALAFFAWSFFTDDGCPGTDKFNIDYKILNAEEYRNTDLYMKNGVSLQDFTVNRGSCTNPNTIAWNNLTDHDVLFRADFTGQSEGVTIKPNNTYSYTFKDKGAYPYTIGETDDKITIN